MTAPYQLEDFLKALDEWTELEGPADWIRLSVLNWIFTRQEAPYLGVKRERGFENLWFGPVPQTVDEQGRIVVCTYWINEHDHSVRCDRFATLSLPL